jgi:hypothetical protein
MLVSKTVKSVKSMIVLSVMLFTSCITFKDYENDFYNQEIDYVGIRYKGELPAQATPEKLRDIISYFCFYIEKSKIEPKCKKEISKMKIEFYNRKFAFSDNLDNFESDGEFIYRDLDYLYLGNKKVIINNQNEYWVSTGIVDMLMMLILESKNKDPCFFKREKCGWNEEVDSFVENTKILFFNW